LSAGKNFQIIETIASGGSAVLYKAVQTSLDRAVAVKKLHPHLTNDPNFTRRFILEAKAAASLDHENIVHVIDFGIDEDAYQIVMEYVEGESLQQVIEKWAPIPPEFALAITYQILLGLEHAHNKGIVHRDIKPGNIMLTRYGRVKITDFGLAKLTQSNTQETAANSILGTPLYMSPEQAFGETVDKRSDLFSLGTVLYEMLTGKQPFAGENYMGVIQNIINKSVPSPKRFNVDIPQPIQAMLSRALSKNRDARFQDSSQFRKLIENYLGAERLKNSQEDLKSLLITNGATIAMRVSTQPGLNYPGRPRRRFAWWASGLAVGAAAAAILFVPGLSNRLIELGGNLFSGGSADPAVMASHLGGDNPLGTLPDLDSASIETEADGEAVSADSVATTNRPPEPTQTDTALTAETQAPVTGQTAPADSSTGSEKTGIGQLADGTEAQAGSPAEPAPKPKAVIKKGWLTVAAYPMAEIYIDGKYAGDTPPSLSLELKSGSHQLETKNPQYESYQEQIKIITGELSRREITLNKLKGQVSLAATEGAELYIDGLLIGVTPIMHSISVDAGRHQFSLRKVGFHSWNSEITVPARELLPLKITLSPRY
jgi:serine/threonine protein kinase